MFDFQRGISQSARIHIHSPFLSHWKRTGKVLYFQIYLLSRCLYRFSEAFPINKQRPGAPVEVERRPWNLNGRLTKTASHDVGGGHRNNGEEKRRRNRRREGRRRGKRRRKAVNLSSGWKRSLGNSDSQPAAIRSDLDFQQRTLQLWHGSTRESSITMSVQSFGKSFRERGFCQTPLKETCSSTCIGKMRVHPVD